MSTDHQKMAAALLRHRAQELRKLKTEDAFRPSTPKPTAAWSRISEGVVLAVADQLDDIAREMLGGKTG